MKIQKKALAAIAEITNELGDQFDELRAEIDRRFGERRSEGEEIGRASCRERV